MDKYLYFLLGAGFIVYIFIVARNANKANKKAIEHNERIATHYEQSLKNERKYMAWLDQVASKGYIYNEEHGKWYKVIDREHEPNWVYNETNQRWEPTDKSRMI